MVENNEEQPNSRSRGGTLIATRKYRYLYENPEHPANETMQCDDNARIGLNSAIIRNATPGMAAYFALIGNEITNGFEVLCAYVDAQRRANREMALHEVIIAHRPRRIAFDMDSGDETIFARIIAHLQTHGVEINAALATWDVYDSSAPASATQSAKFSRHIISATAAARNSQQACAYARKLLEGLDAESQTYLDAALLNPKRSQMLRMCYSTKIDEPSGRKRMKVPFGETANDLAWSFKCSLVQYTQDCEMLPDLAITDMPRDPSRAFSALGSIPLELDQPQIDIISSWCTANSFRMSEMIRPGVIAAIRTGSSHCDICGVVHDHRDGYIVVSLDRIIFRCLRARDNNIDGRIIIWQRIDSRALFIDPRGEWMFPDQHSLNSDLTTQDGLARFKDFAQRNLAFIRFASTPYYLMRVRDIDNAIVFIATTNLLHRGKKCTMLVRRKDTFMRSDVGFDRAIESIIDDISYDGADFVPFFRVAPQINPRFINLWMGYTLQPVAEVNMTLIIPLLDHFKHIWCRDDAILFEYLLNWFAYLIQDPGNPRRTALIVRGLQGCGKTSPVEYIGRSIIGRQYFRKCCIDRISARFNDDLAQKILVLIDETHQSDMSQTALEAKLKDIITSDVVAIETKGLPIRYVRNAMHFIFGSNSELPIRIEPAERRYCVFDCAPVLADNRSAYFGALYGAIENEEAARHIFTFFATRDISRFNIEHVPNTEALIHSKIESMTPQMRFIYEVSCGNVEPWCDDTQDRSGAPSVSESEGPEKEYCVSSQDLFDAFGVWCERNRIPRVCRKMIFDQDIARIIGGAERSYVNGTRKRAHKFTVSQIRDAIKQIIGEKVSQSSS